MDEYECIDCGSVGPYHLFTEHAIECMRGAPEPIKGESFDSWSARVKAWRKEKK